MFGWFLKVWICIIRIIEEFYIFVFRIRYDCLMYNKNHTLLKVRKFLYTFVRWKLKTYCNECQTKYSLQQLQKPTQISKVRIKNINLQKFTNLWTKYKLRIITLPNSIRKMFFGISAFTWLYSWTFRQPMMMILDRRIIF